jgi:hypothetical protein
MVQQTRRCGFSDYQLRLFKVTDTGSAFTLEQSFNLSDIGDSNPPTKFFSWYTDSFVVHEASTSVFRFSLLTQQEINGPNEASIASYEIQNPNDTNPTINLIARLEPFVFSQSSYGGYIEMKGSGDNLYIAKKTELVEEGSNIRIMKLNPSLSVIWDKEIDVLSSGYTDIFDGMVENSNGVAITGRYRQSSGDDWDGFILLLDETGNRIY